MDAPSLTVQMSVYTFLFSDIQGSTRLWEAFPSVMDSVVSRHDELVHGAVRECGGEVYKHTGDGMGAAFSTPSAALEAALRAQQALLSEDWGDIGSLKVRMGVHTGEAQKREGYFFGSCLNHVARLMSAAHGGQILVSKTTALGISELSPQASLVDLGVHRLRDLSRADNIYHLRHPALPIDFPPIKSEKTGNLPEPPDRLLGRESELEQLAQYLHDSRMITLAGFGGTGKTRLALELGHLWAGQFQDGAWFQELAPITDPGVVDKEAASLFGIGEDSLNSYLSDKQLLFIVDNCEHVLAGATSLVQRLLSSPGVTVIATSREALNLEVERTFRVLPLPVPEDKTDRNAFAAFASVQLFQRRALAASPSFELTEENADSAGRIVRRLDGIPRAIELAASRVKLLRPAEIASRLDECFKLLRGGPVDALPHHQTLERTIDWSYDMLSSDQQKLFRQLSVFRGGFTFSAANAVSGTDDEYEVLDSLGQLVDKSLVQSVHTGDEVRYHLLEPLIQYSTARMTAEEAGESRDRHARYFRELAEQAAPELRGPRQLEWLARLDVEHDNLRAALAWGADASDADLAQRTTAALTWFWIIRRYVAEAVTWFDRVLAIEGGSPKARASALVQAGFIGAMVRLDDLEWCLEQIREGSALFVDLGDGQGVETAQVHEAFILWWRREFEASSPMFAEIQEAMRASGFEWGDAFCGWFLGSAAWFIGDLAQAREHYIRGLEIFRRVGDLALIAWSLLPLANIALESGELEQATALYDECLPMMDDLGDRHGAGAVLLGFGMAVHFRGETEETQRLLGEAQTHFREGGGGQGLSWPISNLLVDTSTHYLLIDATRRYQSGLDLPAAEWTRMVFADGEAWRSRPRTTP